MIYDEKFYAFKLTPQYEYHPQINFLSTDSAKEYAQNVKKKGKDWEWFKKEITYNLNSLGYRTKEIDDLKDDYILALGCSYTEGIGLNEEDIYINKLGKHFNLDVFNLAHGGMGIDYCFYNTINYLKSLKKYPKLVVYQWPFETRKLFMYANKITEYFGGFDLIPPYYGNSGFSSSRKMLSRNQQYLLDKDDEWYEDRFLADEGEIMINLLFYIDTCNMIWENLNIPVFNFHWPAGDKEKTVYYNFMLNKKYPFFLYEINIDLARDLKHAGVKSHEHLTSLILKDLNENKIYPKERLL